MNATDRLMSEAEDDYMLFITKLQPKRCDATARRHARSLQQRATMAMTAGYLDDALWFSERSYEFCARAFGISDAQSKTSLKSLAAIRSYQTTAQFNAQNGSKQVQVAWNPGQATA